MISHIFIIIFQKKCEKSPNIVFGFKKSEDEEKKKIQERRKDIYILASWKLMLNLEINLTICILSVAIDFGGGWKAVNERR